MSKEVMEQEPKMLDLCGCGHPFKEHDWGAYSNGEATCLVEKCDCPNFTRKRLDRPELWEKAEQIAIKTYDMAKGDTERSGYEETVVRKATLEWARSAIEALIPDTDQLDKFYLRVIEDKVEEAKREEREEILEKLEKIDEIARDHRDFAVRTCQLIVDLRQALGEK